MLTFTKMKKPLYQEVEIPEGVEVTLKDNSVTVKGPEGENKRELNTGKLKITMKDGKIKIGHEKSSKKEKKQMNTIAAHLRNLILGVTNKFEYKLKICFSHFPFTVKQEGAKITIKNFLGEKIDRETTLPENVEMKIDKEFIEISSTDKEKAGQAAANLERITKIKGRDIRIFQDGIYIVNKAGKEI